MAALPAMLDWPEKTNSFFWALALGSENSAIVIRRMIDLIHVFDREQYKV